MNPKVSGSTPGSSWPHVVGQLSTTVYSKGLIKHVIIVLHKLFISQNIQCLMLSEIILSTLVKQDHTQPD